jgi:hypothetical protein
MVSSQYAMYFPESEAIVCKHQDLEPVIELVDAQLSEIYSSAPLRPADFACVIGADPNQVVAVFDLLAKHEVLLSEAMVECERCQNLMSAVAFRQAIDDEDDFECSTCSRRFRRNTAPITVYRMAVRVASRPKPIVPEADLSATSGEEPLSERAQLVLIAMIELNAIDSDARCSTEDIAARALGPRADANALKAVMSELNTRQLIQTKTGRGGGCWLTTNGQSRATKLRNR